jgi:hypothetical protein
LTNGLPRLQKFNEGGLITFREQVLPSVLLRGQGKLRDVDGWLRNRLRYCIWHHWKNCSKAEIANTNKNQLESELNQNGKGKT